MSTKERVTVTVDHDLVAAGRAAMAAGAVDSLSSWVNGALRAQVDRDRRLAALRTYVDVYEAEHGVITDDDTRAARQRMRERAIVVAPGPAAVDPGHETR